MTTTRANPGIAALRPVTLSPSFIPVMSNDVLAALQRPRFQRSNFFLFFHPSSSFFLSFFLSFSLSTAFLKNRYIYSPPIRPMSQVESNAGSVPFCSNCCLILYGLFLYLAHRLTNLLEFRFVFLNRKRKSSSVII